MAECAANDRCAADLCAAGGRHRFGRGRSQGGRPAQAQRVSVHRPDFRSRALRHRRSCGPAFGLAGDARGGRHVPGRRRRRTPSRNRSAKLCSMAAIACAGQSDPRRIRRRDPSALGVRCVLRLRGYASQRFVARTASAVLPRRDRSDDPSRSLGPACWARRRVCALARRWAAHRLPCRAGAASLYRVRLGDHRRHHSHRLPARHSMGARAGRSVRHHRR